MKLKATFGLLALALALSGCAGIPKSSEVYFGEEISEDTSDQFVRVIARPPSIGMSPEEIVNVLNYLLDDKSNYFNGHDFVIDGGHSIKG